jgi:hypothetical protein
VSQVVKLSGEFDESLMILTPGDPIDEEEDVALVSGHHSLIPSKRESLGPDSHDQLTRIVRIETQVVDDHGNRGVSHGWKPQVSGLYFG